MTIQTERELIGLLKRIDDSTNITSCATADSLTGTIDNRHAEVVDTGTLTLTGVSNYSYSVIAGSAEVTINGVTITGIPLGFDARQGETSSGTLLNDITITGEAGGTIIYVYYELG
jgi:hypothetical protein